MLLYMSSDDDSKLFRDTIGPVMLLSVNRTRPRAGVAGGTITLSARNRGARDRAEGESGTIPASLSGITYVPQAVEPSAVISFKRPGVQDRQIRKLKRARYDDATTLDLHGLTVVQARAAVQQFISQAGERGTRCVLISHGKGEGRARPALLKSWVNQWLRDSAAVLAFHSARPQHGGSGATCVLVAKAPCGDHPHPQTGGRPVERAVEDPG